MRKKIFFALLSANVALVACRKETPEPAHDLIVQENSYFPTAVGNYWIYELYQVNLDGSFNKIGRVDSVVVTGDTVLNGKKYAVLKELKRATGAQVFWPQYVCDSSGYIGKEAGFVFSSTNLTDTLAKYTIQSDVHKADYTWWMQPGEQEVHVPAGTFMALNCKKKIVFRFYDQPTKIDEYDNWFVKGIGPVCVQEEWHYAMGLFKIERQLVRYSVKYRKE